MSLLKLDLLIGEGTHGFNRRVGNDFPQGRPGARRRGEKRRGRNALAMLQGSPEVMVKISGFGRGKGVERSMLYLTREDKAEVEDKLTLERADGSLVKGKDEIRALAQEWEAGNRRRHPKQRDTMNLVLSMPPGTDPKAVGDASRRFAERQFQGKRDYVLVQHHDEAHPHVHLMVKMAGFDRTRLDPNREDLQRWRESFAEALREHGVEAAATPRKTRGQTRKPRRQALAQMRKRGVTPKVDAEQLREIALELSETGQAKPRPWEQAIADGRKQTVSMFEKAISQLAQSPDANDRYHAQLIEQHLRNMPPPSTRRDDIRVAFHARQRGQIEPDLTVTREPQDGKDRDR